MEELPEELKLEILVRMPVKSLACLKCMSKSWRSRISNPNFAKMQFQLSNHSQQRPSRILLTTSPHLKSVDINASLHDDSATINLDFPTPEPNTEVHIMGSCRGIVLLQIKQDLFLWNPVTGSSKQISLPPQWESVIAFVFCYHEPIDDYFIGVSYHRRTRPPNEELFEVVSLKTNSWEKLGLSHSYHRAPIPSLGTIFNGAIHFIADYRTLSRVFPQLFAFDITTKELRKLPPPICGGRGGLLTFAELGVLEGCLALTGDAQVRIIVWVMREYGVTSSWTQLISVVRNNFHSRVIGWFLPQVLYKEGDDEFVTPYYDKEGCALGLSKWNYRRQLLEYRTYGPILGNRDSYIMEPWRRAIAYTETLLPLP